ncbi:2-oxoacid:ferredoxin oxidoreductase subunit beta [Candidatus Woesearchaeota archaeon]|nr:MAG: 2-oxoacid:ferredoxin oxidoreductase subunit beta [Candidatus Woesearchaeota archaeon]
MVKPADLKTDEVITFCPGCGNYGILAALKNAVSELGLREEDVVIVSGVGCHGHMANFVRVYTVQSLHGRPVPFAMGVKIANKKLHVIVLSGDGDSFGEGLNHFINVMRGNSNITYICHDNIIYGLTTGQRSPTADKSMITKSTPFGAPEIRIIPVKLALVSGATFVARSYAGDIRHLTDIIKQGIKHEGISFIDVLQPCVTFNKINTFDFYNKRVYKLEKARHNKKSLASALKKAEEWGDKIPIGVFYQERRETFDEFFKQKQPLISRNRSKIDVSKTLEEHK